MKKTAEKLNEYLWELDEIERLARKRYSRCTGLYLHNVIHEFLRYWRRLQREASSDISGREWIRLSISFDQKLREIAYARLEIEWLIWEHDDSQLHREEFEVYPLITESLATKWKRYPR